MICPAEAQLASMGCGHPDCSQACVAFLPSIIPTPACCSCWSFPHRKKVLPLICRVSLLGILVSWMSLISCLVEVLLIAAMALSL